MPYPRTNNTYTSNAVAASGSVKVGSGTVFSFFVTNVNAVTRYFMIFDKATAVTTGDLPLLVFPVYGNAAATEINKDVLRESGQVCDNGIAWGLSTTPGSFTAAATTDALVLIVWA